MAFLRVGSLWLSLIVNSLIIAQERILIPGPFKVCPNAHFTHAACMQATFCCPLCRNADLVEVADAFFPKKADPLNDYEVASCAICIEDIVDVASSSGLIASPPSPASTPTARGVEKEPEFDPKDYAILRYRLADDLKKTKSQAEKDFLKMQVYCLERETFRHKKS